MREREVGSEGRGRGKEYLVLDDILVHTLHFVCRVLMKSWE